MSYFKQTSDKVYAIIERAKADARIKQSAFPQLRYGQSFMNSLPLDYFNALCGSDVDPFSDDNLMPEAEAFLYDTFAL